MDSQNLKRINVKGDGELVAKYEVDFILIAK